MKRRRTWKSASQAGFSLAELLVASGIILLLVAAGSKMIGSFSEHARSLENLRKMQRFSSNLRAIVQNPANIRKTAELTPNLYFKRCLNISSPGDSDCWHMASANFELTSWYDATGRNLSSGTTSFNANGERCSVASISACPYAMRTWFRAQCRNSTTTCSAAAVLEVWIEVLISRTIWNSMPPFARQFPAGYTLDPTPHPFGVRAVNNLPYWVEVTDGMISWSGGASPMRTCLPENFLIGYDAQRQPICEGQGGEPAIPKFAASSCPAGTYMKGFTVTGTPDCVPFSPVRNLACPPTTVFRHDGYGYPQCCPADTDSLAKCYRPDNWAPIF